MVRVTPGSVHLFAIDSVGDVWGVGLSLHGQIGVDIGEGGYMEIIQTPRRVSAMRRGSPIVAGSRVVDIACGEFHSASLLDNGLVFACGAYDNGQLGVGPGHVLASVNKVHHPRVRGGEAGSPLLRANERGLSGSRRTPGGAWRGPDPTCLFGVWEMSVSWDLGSNVDGVFQPTLVDLAGWKPVQASRGEQPALSLFTKD